MDWFLWRLVTHPKIRITWEDLRERLTLGDAQRAHDVLDALDEHEFIVSQPKT